MCHRWMISAVLLGCLTASGSKAAEPATVPASTSAKQAAYEPAEKIRGGEVDPRFLAAHARFLQRIESGPIGLLFV